MDITHPIRAARQAKRLTQTQLAEKLGVTKGAVSQWELGNKMPSSDLMAKLTKLLPRLSFGSIYAAHRSNREAA